MLFKLLSMAESLITYEPVDSFLHRLHPLSKLALLFFVIIGGMYVSRPTFPWWLNFALFVFLVFLALSGRIPLGKELRLRRAYILVIVSVLFCGNLVFARGGEETFATNPRVTVYFKLEPVIYASSVGLNFAISKTLLIISSIVAVIVVLKSTRLADLTFALQRIGMPYSIATITSTSLRSIPMVVDGLSIVYNAERARGMELDKGGARERIKQWQQLVIPLITVLLKWVDQMTTVFQSRGLDFSARERTRLRELVFRPADAFMILSLATVLFGFIFLHLTGRIIFDVY